MNQADGQFLQEGLNNRNLESIDFPSEADLLILNTYTVRASTAGRMISRLKQLTEISLEAQIPLVISGCLASAQIELVNQHSPNAILLPPRALGRWREILSTLQSEISYEIISKCQELASTPLKRDVNTLSGLLEGKTYTIPIAEGCLGNCNYCIVKKARGNLASFPSPTIISHIKQALSRGAKEIRLTAQDTGIYGLDSQVKRSFSRETLGSLIQKIIEIPGDFRIRVGMMNPDGIINHYQQLFQLFDSNKLFSFLHLPIQSGSNRILKAMNRKYTIEQFLILTQAFRKICPESTLATDIIVAYPDETEEDFELTKKIILTTKPEKVHVARYSRRPGTKAAKLIQVPAQIAKQRSRELAKLRLEIASQQNRLRVGKRFPTLITGRSIQGQILGRTQSYRPVIITTPTSKPFRELLGKIVYTEIIDAGQVDLKGRILEEKKEIERR